MDTAVAHLTEYWPIYLAGLAVLVPLLYFTRNYSMPLIQAGIEVVLYFAVFHIVLSVTVMLIARFKDSTQLWWEHKDPTPWKTPILQFWDRSLYDPAWIFYFEAVVVVGILIAMLRLRPMRTQRRPRRESKPVRKGEVPEHLKRRYSQPDSLSKRK